eukprot:1853541-Rhodomonas_salina.1
MYRPTPFLRALLYCIRPSYARSSTSMYALPTKSPVRPYALPTRCPVRGAHLATGSGLVLLKPRRPALKHPSSMLSLVTVAVPAPFQPTLALETHVSPPRYRPRSRSYPFLRKRLFFLG